MEHFVLSTSNKVWKESSFAEHLIQVFELTARPDKVRCFVHSRLTLERRQFYKFQQPINWLVCRI
jgi:hypothetical protein